ncbi:MAG: Rossmann-like and DUF2520 domain-containing protein [Candidatus Korobacteraceae bacterium]|jgi:predicted short-subunit dehydrogenase-like oxidoreductase (DUF2520 family)
MSGAKPTPAGLAGALAGWDAAAGLTVAAGSDAVSVCLLQPALKAAIRSRAKMGAKDMRSLGFMLDSIVNRGPGRRVAEAEVAHRPLIPRKSGILPAVPKRTSSNRRPAISIVGPGNLGIALALTLAPAGYEVRFLAARGKSVGNVHVRALSRRLKARVVEIGKQQLDTEIVWITVPDDAIAGVARVLAQSQDWKGKIVLHSSGAVTSDELFPLRDKGARVASVHPMMTFVRGAVPEMEGVAFAVEGDAAAVRAAISIVEELGGDAFVIKKQNKVLYHVFGSFASPLVIALMASLEEVAQAAGIRKTDIRPMMAPLLWQTLRNYLKHDAASAFSGPLIRGDVATVSKHLAELKKLPEAKAVYVALASAALKLLPVRNRKILAKTLRSS